jgi:hypothetical protein
LRKLPAFCLFLLSVSCSLFRPKVGPYPTGVVFPLAEAGQVEFEGRINLSLEKGADGRLYFSTDTGHLYCLDGAKQEICWHQPNPAPFGCPPLVGPERLFLWDRDNIVSCYDRQGNPGWRMNLPEQISSPISADGEKVYLGTQAGELLALSQATGEIVWRFPTKAAITAAAVFYGDSIIVGSGDGFVYVLNARSGRRSSTSAARSRSDRSLTGISFRRDRGRRLPLLQPEEHEAEMEGEGGRQAARATQRR